MPRPVAIQEKQDVLPITPVRHPLVDVRVRVDPARTHIGAYFAAAAAILGGSITIDGVEIRKGRGTASDQRFYELIRQMGCAIGRRSNAVNVSRAGSLLGLRANVAACAETFPALAAIAAFAETPSELGGLARARTGGSDAVAVMCAGLRALGARAEDYADGLSVEPAPLHGAVVDAGGQAGVAMAFAVVGLQVPGVAVAGSEAASALSTGFYDVLRDLAG